MNQNQPQNQNPSSNIYPSPQDRNQNPQPLTKNNKWFIYLVIAVIVIGSFIFLGRLIYAIYFAQKIAKEGPSAFESPNQIQMENDIRNNFNNLRNSLIIYYQNNKTYQGWSPDNAVLIAIQDKGTEIKTQILTNDNYLIYGQLPYTRRFVCIDPKRLITIDQINSDKTQCCQSEKECQEQESKTIYQ